jgi:hypothetical protein
MLFLPTEAFQKSTRMETNADAGTNDKKHHFFYNIISFIKEHKA